MPLVKQTIVADILSLLDKTSKANAEDAQTMFADGMADIIIKHMKAADVNVSVNTTLTGVAGVYPIVGTGSGTGKGKIS